MYHGICVRGSEDSFRESVLSSHCVGSGSPARFGDSGLASQWPFYSKDFYSLLLPIHVTVSPREKEK